MKRFDGRKRQKPEGLDHLGLSEFRCQAWISGRREGFPVRSEGFPVRSERLEIERSVGGWRGGLEPRTDRQVFFGKF